MGRIVGGLRVSALVLIALTLLGGVSLIAQTSAQAGIQGKVVDPTGAPVPHATVTARNPQNAVQGTGESNGSGEYVISPLQPGNYTVLATAQGFAPLVQKISVESASVVNLPFKLMVGSGGGVEVTPIQPPLPLMETPAPDAAIVEGRAGNTSAAAVPLFRDPVHDGAADPVVVWNRAKKVWWMFYTNRRADIADTSGVRWVHGTHIGIAESADGGAHWKYVSEADIPLPRPDYTLWAPEVIDVDGTYHMFLTVVPGIFTDWNAERHIEHLTSKDLLHWTYLADVNLESDRTIDACVFKLPDGNWRLWYKDERIGSKIRFSDSPDLVHWTAEGIAVTTRGEGPVVFEWHGSYWLINDSWAGLGVFKSSDLTTWTRQPDNLLREPGTQPTDLAMGNHPDVVVDGSGRAWLFYFTQQKGEDAKPDDPTWQRRSVLHVTELHEKDGVLTVDRNAPAYIHMLPPPANKKSDVAKAWKMESSR